MEKAEALNKVGPRQRGSPLTAEASMEGERFVRRLLDEVATKLLEETSPYALLLQGSFARGDGTVRFDDEGRPQLWRDLDLVLIYRTRESPSTLEEIEHELNDLEGVEPGPTVVEGGEISFAQLPKFLVERWRDLKTYELATASRLLYGEDIRESMAVRDGDIPIESGLRFLYQKAIGLCLVYNRLDEDPFPVNYEIAKLYLELGNVLCLLADAPTNGHHDRVSVLRDGPLDRTGELIDRIEAWGSHKIQGDTESLSDRDSKAAWNQARDDLLSVLTLCHHDGYGRDPDWSSRTSVLRFYRHVSSRFLPTTAATMLGKRWPPSTLQASLAGLLHRGYRLYPWITRKADWRITKGCPLLGVYLTAVVLLTRLEVGSAASPAVDEAHRFLMETGITGSDIRGQGWAKRLNDLYFEMVNPLYGV